MRHYKNIYDMTQDELDEYLDDIQTGYAFDPDNEILDADKQLPAKELFRQLNKEVASSQFKSWEEFAAVVSRVSRFTEWLNQQIIPLSERMNTEFQKKVAERKQNEGENY